jgi:phosphoribosylformylglycinamidine synthase subunit PurQ / glutaminase
MKPKCAIIQFPGSNCEYETQRSADYYGFDSEIIRWNCTEDEFKAFDSYIIPGGFSYQDRVRAGAISAKLPISGLLVNAVDEGKAVLGICNGCQILAETGLITNSNQDHSVDVALAHNTKEGKRIGFICDWVFVKVQKPEQNIFTRYFNQEDVIPIPINHGEGRFVFSEQVRNKIDQLAHFTYCDADGNEGSFPITPNGSEHNIAGIGNQKGTVFAMMPHPERAAFIKQIPFWIQSKWSDQKRETFKTKTSGAGPWEKLFVSLRDKIAQG